MNSINAKTLVKKELTGQLTLKSQTNNQNDLMNSQNTSFPGNVETVSFSDLAPKSFSAACRGMLDELKNRLVKKLAAEFSDVREDWVRQAVTEADSLASLTVVPHLLLPALAEEKVRGLRYWALRQRSLFGHPIELAA